MCVCGGGGGGEGGYFENKEQKTNKRLFDLVYS